ncbi:Methyltransferase domain-containing protein [Variovorax sp. OV329]|nr:Methyltransferase domain-containing protein [Variovorax sp. OV329]
MSTVYDDEFYDRQSQGSLASAEIILRKVFDLLPAESVIDVGCGVAPWLLTALGLGATRGLGVDGNYVDPARLLVDPALFQACNLEENNLLDAISDPKKFDLVICVEVAEHLSDGRAPGFIAELCALGDLVLFSAAIPEQGGANHINEQWPTYWASHFATHGFDCFDVLRKTIWGESRCEWWYVQNSMMFSRRGSDAHRRLVGVEQPTAVPQSLVHPRMLTHTRFYLQEQISQLEKLAHYQPFGRDEAIRALEARTDTMRQLALERQNEVNILNGQLAASQAETAAVIASKAELQNRLAAVLASTSWRITKPMRWLARSLRSASKSSTP